MYASVQGISEIQIDDVTTQVYAMAIDDVDDLDTLSNNSSQSILEEPEAEEDEEFPELFNVP